MRKRKFLISAFLGALLFFTYTGCSSRTDSSGGFYYVARIVDGDTVELNTGEKLRYIGIDTAETREKVAGEWIYNPEDYAEEAKELNEGLVKGKRVRIEFDVDRKDKYGRLLGYVFVDNKFVNEELLAEGLAFLYTYPPNVRYVERLVAAQKKARRLARGFWKDIKTIDYRQAGNHIGEFVKIRGKVKDAVKTDSVLLLNFNEQKVKGFTAVIFTSNLKGFYRDGINPVDDYKDKQVEITGKVKLYKGPEIIVTHPSQIVIVGD